MKTLLALGLLASALVLPNTGTAKRASCVQQARADYHAAAELCEALATESEQRPCIQVARLSHRQTKAACPAR
jgi:hypothetical protein